MKPVTYLILGGGSRGTTYAEYAREHPEKAKVVGVAEPRDFFRRRLAERHAIPGRQQFTTWEDALAVPRFADAAIVATQDNLHAEPAIAAVRAGYHLLLEKPMAPTEEECRRIIDAVKKSGVLFGVCHVLRYTDLTRNLREQILSGRIGDIISLQHLEPVGYWHQAHSFVRGNWRNEKESTFMLLAKSCHDLDWIRFIVGEPCRSVASFGALSHFTRQAKPPNAGTRCLQDCPAEVEARCPYSARKIYLQRAARGETGWPHDILTSSVTVESIADALRNSPYGRCVYECDNDVVDHQVVILNFCGGQTAAFTMTAFTEIGHRRTQIFGTRGEMWSDGETISRFDFLSDTWSKTPVSSGHATLLGGHGGGDYRLMEHFTAAVADGDQKQILSGPEESLESHLMVFAVEKARRQNKVIDLL
ncbi:MAG TPA: Gfo/Idh/MocA family oxidoreductase [bacterium]|nr:Gfo/Idh/MocA family oxidoreductase [bacterium]